MDAQADTEFSASRKQTVPYHRGIARLEDFRFESGAVLPYVDISYETWGTQNAARDNTVVICHALTGDAHAGPGDPDGWWGKLISPGGAIDTDTQFVLASNVLGGCAGSTGPASLAEDGHPYALRFPLLTVRDIVLAQIRLLDALGIGQVEMVIGGSLGGMQAWEWALMAPDRVRHAVAIAAHAAFPPLAIGYNEAMRAAIVGDPAWQHGNYYNSGRTPVAGLNVARSIGMLTYRTDALYQARFGREAAYQGTAGVFAPARGNVSGPSFAQLGGGAEQAALAAFTAPQFAVESYLHYQGEKLNSRFDANTYLYLSRAMDSHDIGRNRGGVAQALRHTSCRLTVIAIDSDYLYDCTDLRKTAETARQVGANCTYLELSSAYGHDAFLLEQERLGQLLQNGMGGRGA